MTVLRLERGWESLLEGEAGHRLEGEVLPDFLRRQRWFAGKARGLDTVRIADAAPLGPAGDVAMVLLLVEATYRDDGRDVYLLPVAVVSGSLAERLAPGAALTRVEGPGGGGSLVDALGDDASCAALLDAIASGARIVGRSGEFRAFPTALFAESRGEPGEGLAVVRGTAEQSNSAVLYGDRLILKLFRRLEPGLNPDFEIGRFLSERAGFDRIPKTAGAIEYRRPGEEPATVALLQGLVKNEGTGWEHALGELARYYEAALASAEAGHAPPPEAIDATNPYLASARTLGRRTAEMHRALASDPADPAFAPEPLTPRDLVALADEVREQARRALDALRSAMGRLPESVAATAGLVAEGVPGLLGQLDALAASEVGAAKVRCHGDYHLGQVLRTGDDFVILDFEGEPARPMAKRREKTSPIKDVVGMLRSFDYAAYAGLFAAARDRAEIFDQLAPRALGWIEGASGAFLDAYLATASGSPFLPRDPAALTRLLQAYTLDKALYELLYELNNRPDWVGIPLQGIRSLIERGRGAATP